MTRRRSVSSRPRSSDVATCRAKVSSSARSLPAKVATSPSRPDTSSSPCTRPSVDSTDDHRVLERVPCGVAVQLGPRRVRRCGWSARRSPPSARRPAGRRPPGARAPQGDRLLAVAAAAQRRDGVALAEEDQLGRPGPEGAADGGQEVGERGLGVVAVVEQRGDLVQQPQVVLLLARLGVGAVGGDEQHRRQRQQDQRRRARAAAMSRGEQADRRDAEGEGQRQRRACGAARGRSAERLGHAHDARRCTGNAVTFETATAASAATQSHGARSEVPGRGRDEDRGRQAARPARTGPG